MPSHEPYRSKSEAIIAEILTRAGISFRYEQALAVNTRGRLRIWHPDFSLPHGVIIEYAGMPDDPDYQRGIENKQRVYEQLGIPVIWLYPHDIWEVRNGRYQRRHDAAERVQEKVEEALRDRTWSLRGQGGIEARLAS